jgi:hypothetical protein
MHEYYTIDPAKLDKVLDLCRQHITAPDLDNRVRAFIVADWPEGAEHQQWLDSATAEEIADWVYPVLLNTEPDVDEL